MKPCKQSCRTYSSLESPVIHLLPLVDLQQHFHYYQKRQTFLETNEFFGFLAITDRTYLSETGDRDLFKHYFLNFFKRLNFYFSILISQTLSNRAVSSSNFHTFYNLALALCYETKYKVSRKHMIKRILLDTIQMKRRRSGQLLYRKNVWLVRYRWAKFLASFWSNKGRIVS